MNICTKCGAELNEGAKFCKACGSGLPGHDNALVNEKKARVTAGERKRLWTAGIISGALVAFLAVSVLYLVFRGEPDSSPRMFVKTTAGSDASVATSYTTAHEENGLVRIPLAGLASGKAGFYTYTAGGMVIKFFVLRKPDGSIGAALDACNACYRAKMGYRQEGPNVICNNCGMAFRPEDVGVVTGGCNPIPLKSTVAADTLVINAAELEKWKMYF